MVKNMGLIDRLVRVALAVLVGVLYLTDQISGVAALVLGIFAVVFVITSAIGFCPLYVPFKIKTKK